MDASRKPRSKFVCAAAAVGVLVTLAACGGQSGPPVADGNAKGSCAVMDEVRYQTKPGFLGDLLSDVAVAKGIWEEQCISPEPLSPNGPVAIAQAVAGDIDVLFQGPDNVYAARAEGVDIKIIGNRYAGSFFSLVVSTRVPGVESASYQEIVSALRGRQLGVNVVGGQNYFVARSTIEGGGVDPDDVKYVALGTGTAIIAGLQNGVIDAAELFGNEQDIAVAMGIGKMYADTRRPPGPDNEYPEELVGLNGSQNVWVATEGFLDANPDLAKRFVEGSDAAIAWMKDPANRDELYAIASKKYAFPSEVPDSEEAFESTVDIYADMASSQLDPDSLNNWAAYTSKTRDVQITETADDLIWSEAAR